MATGAEEQKARSRLGGEDKRFRYRLIPEALWWWFPRRAQETSRYEKPTALGLAVREPS
jgi:hypothetical protein